ncbi:hypothetical protein RFI_30740, partial [Reticulomyxa filosa]
VCILHFHPSMRRSPTIFSCDVSWISPREHEREILFARSYIHYINDDQKNNEIAAWNAKIESEDEHTQTILLTWARYDEYIQQTLQISAMWKNPIDLNLAFVLLFEIYTDIDTVNILLGGFHIWKKKRNNEQRYNEKKKQFMAHRCCNHNINLFSIFLFENKIIKATAVEFATIHTINSGLPIKLLLKELYTVLFFLYCSKNFMHLEKYIDSNGVLKNKLKKNYKSSKLSSRLFAILLLQTKKKMDAVTLKLGIWLHFTKIFVLSQSNTLDRQTNPKKMARERCKKNNSKLVSKSSRKSRTDQQF